MEGLTLVVPCLSPFGVPSSRPPSEVEGEGLALLPSAPFPYTPGPCSLSGRVGVGPALGGPMSGLPTSRLEYMVVSSPTLQPSLPAR